MNLTIPLLKQVMGASKGKEYLKSLYTPGKIYMITDKNRCYRSYISATWEKWIFSETRRALGKIFNRTNIRPDHHKSGVPTALTEAAGSSKHTAPLKNRLLKYKTFFFFLSLHKMTNTYLFSKVKRKEKGDIREETAVRRWWLCSKKLAALAIFSPSEQKQPEKGDFELFTYNSHNSFY